MGGVCCVVQFNASGLLRSVEEALSAGVILSQLAGISGRTLVDLKIRLPRLVCTTVVSPSTLMMVWALPKTSLMFRTHIIRHQRRAWVALLIYPGNLVPCRVTNGRILVVWHVPTVLLSFLRRSCLPVIVRWGVASYEPV